MKNLLFSPSPFLLRHVLVIQQSQLTVQTVRQSSLIGLEGLLNLLLVACQKVEEEMEAKRRNNTLFEESSNIKNDHTLLLHAKEKLIQILAEEVLIPKQRWSLCKILAMLVFYQNNLRLCPAFHQFQFFAFQTMLPKSECKSH